MKNKALAAFMPFIGTWKTVGSHGMIPNVTLHGQTTFSWHESGAFVRVESSIEEDVGIPAGVALIGSDDEAHKWMMLYFDTRGVSRHYEVRIDGNVLQWWRDHPGFRQRYTLTLSGDTIVGKGEIAKDGGDWEKDLDLTYTKV